jgi:hypothetical protein
MKAHRLIVFPYGLSDGRLSPLVPVGFCLGGQWQVAELYVDSGAFYTLMHAQFATDFGLDFKKGRRVLVQVGDGSLIPVYLHRLPMQIGSERFQATVGFSERLGVRFHLLGRQDVYERFRVCFHEKRRVVTFQPVG